MYLLMSVILCLLEKMSEKLCLQWNDFKENVNSAFGRLRGDIEFTDVTLLVRMVSRWRHIR